MIRIRKFIKGETIIILPHCLEHCRQNLLFFILSCFFLEITQNEPRTFTLSILRTVLFILFFTLRIRLFHFCSIYTEFRVPLHTVISKVAKWRYLLLCNLHFYASLFCIFDRLVIIYYQWGPALDFLCYSRQILLFCIDSSSIF